MGPAETYEVECTACGGRFQVKGKGTYEVQRHWDVKHMDRLSKGEKASSRMVAQGSGKIDALKNWQLTKKDDTKDVDNKDNQENEIGNMELDEAAEEQSKKSGFEDIGDEEEDGNGNKRSKGNIVNLLLEKLTEMGSKMTNMDKKVDAVKEEIDAQKKGSLVKKKVQTGVMQGVDDELSEAQISFILKNCKTVEDLEHFLEQLNLEKRADIEEGVDGYFCVLCFQGLEPNWRNRDRVAGVFRCEKEEPGEGGKQSQKFAT